mgnify:CR=1 FL=1
MIEALRNKPNINGMIFFSSKSFNKNPNGWNDSLQLNYFKEPAKTPKIILLGGFGMAICLLVLPFLHSPTSMALLILIYGFFGGIFIVPLNTILQVNAPTHGLGRLLSGKNFFQNLAMLFFLGGSVLFALQAYPLIHIFLILFVILITTMFILFFFQKNLILSHQK